MQCLHSLKRQQGVVIVVALFIVALTAVMAYYMMARLERDVVRTELLLHHVQAENEVQGSIAWAMDQLRHNWVSRKNNRLVDVMPMRSPVNDENGYQIRTVIYDMQGRFNLNNISSSEAQAGFLNLVHQVAPAISNEQTVALTKAIIDWITPGQQQNSYYQYYIAKTPSYRASHQPLLTLGELRRVKELPSSLLAMLEPYVVALPVGTLVNVQTASAEVLLTIHPSMKWGVAKAIVQARATNPLLTNEDFFKLDVIKNNHIITNQLTTVSQYFLVETDVKIGKQNIVIYTLLARATTNTSATLRVLWQSKGVW